MKYQYDLLVVGSGSAGFSAAHAAKGQGRKIGMIEADRMGGECPNWACVPTKALLKSAKVYRQGQHAATFGVLGAGGTMDLGRIMARRHKMSDALGGPRIERIADSLGIDVIKGRAVFLDEHTVEVAGVEYTSERFIIATGSTTFVPPIPGIQDVPWIDFKQAVSLEKAPESLLVLGGGPVGCEIATFWATYGIPVTLVQAAPHVLHRDGEEISELVEQQLRELGIELHLGAEVVELSQDGEEIVARTRVGRSIESLRARTLLLATGKTSVTAGLGCKAAGVKLDERGTIITNTELRTSADHIWAAGDVNGGERFTHTAHHEGNLAGFNAFAKKPQRFDGRVIPRVTFVTPEVASVGITEVMARQEVKSILVGRFQMGGLGRSFIDGETVGLVKLIADKKTRRLLGGHICAPRAGEMIHEVALAMYTKATIDDLAEMMHAYPTYSEAIAAAASLAISEE